MARAKKPPRLKRRGKNGTFYIIDGENRVSTQTSNPHEAEMCLNDYVEGLRAPAKRSNVTLDDLLAAYAQSRVAERADRLSQKAYEDGIKSGMSVEDATELKKQVSDDEKRKEFSGKYEIKALSRHLGKLSAADLDSKTIRAFVRMRLADEHRHAGKKIQMTTAKKNMGILNASLNWADNNDTERWFGSSGRPKFSTPSIPDQVRHDFLTQDQVRLLLECCHLPHVRLFIAIAVHTGARKGAIESLPWSGVDFEKEIIDFGEDVGNKRRPVSSMTPELKQMLEDAYRVRCSNYVIEFAGRRAGNVKKSLKTVAVRAGLPWATAHVFKHTFISWMVAIGAPYSQISDLTNTSEDTIRKHYAHLHPSSKQAVQSATAGLFHRAASVVDLSNNNDRQDDDDDERMTG